MIKVGRKTVWYGESLQNPTGPWNFVGHFTKVLGVEGLPILYDGQGARLASVLDVDIVPTTYIFRSNGKVIGKGLGLKWLVGGKYLSGGEKLKKVIEWLEV